MESCVARTQLFEQAEAETPRHRRIDAVEDRVRSGEFQPLGSTLWKHAPTGFGKSEAGVASVRSRPQESSGLEEGIKDCRRSRRRSAP